MHYSFQVIILCLSTLTIYAQSPVNTSLKKELDSMMVQDQKYRGALSANIRGKGDSLAAVYNVRKEDLNDYLWREQAVIDSLNSRRVAEIIKEFGYPGISLVGSPTNEAAFYIIQHSKEIDQYLPVIKEAAEKKELRFQLYAMMLDRSLMLKDKEQLYGTQGSGLSVKDTTTGKWENLSFIWPIKDPQTVNERRKAAGFTTTAEENARQLGIEYKVYTLQEVRKMIEAVRNS